ncbi:MAG: hypothetical protein ACKN9W_04925 [Methylococcus sp.]
MQAIEFETMALHQTIRLPQGIPDGVNLRVLVLLEDPPPAQTTGNLRQQPQRPAPQLARSVTMTDDLIQPAVPESDWNVLR